MTWPAAAYAGFGTLMAAMTVFLPLYWGAACTATLFPLLIVVAGDCKSMREHGGASGQLGRLPVFWLALAPTQILLGFLPKTLRSN